MYGSIFREINLQNHTLAVTTLNQRLRRGSLLPFYVSMQQEGSNLWLELLKAIPNHFHFVYLLYSIVDALPQLIVNWIGIVDWSILDDGICTLGSICHSYMHTFALRSHMTCSVNAAKSGIQGGMLLECYKQKPHFFMVVTHPHLMWDLFK